MLQGSFLIGQDPRVGLLPSGGFPFVQTVAVPAGMTQTLGAANLVGLPFPPTFFSPADWTSQAWRRVAPHTVPSLVVQVWQQQQVETVMMGRRTGVETNEGRAAAPSNQSETVGGGQKRQRSLDQSDSDNFQAAVRAARVFL